MVQLIGIYPWLSEPLAHRLEAKKFDCNYVGSTNKRAVEHQLMFLTRAFEEIANLRRIDPNHSLLKRLDAWLDSINEGNGEPLGISLLCRAHSALPSVVCFRGALSTPLELEETGLVLQGLSMNSIQTDRIVLHGLDSRFPLLWIISRRL